MRHDGDKKQADVLSWGWIGALTYAVVRLLQRTSFYETALVAIGAASVLCGLIALLRPGFARISARTAAVAFIAMGVGVASVGMHAWTMAALSAFTLIIWGLVGAMSPSWLGIPRRWIGVGAVFLGFGLLVIAGGGVNEAPPASPHTTAPSQQATSSPNLPASIQPGVSTSQASTELPASIQPGVSSSSQATRPSTMQSTPSQQEKPPAPKQEPENTQEAAKKEESDRQDRPAQERGENQPPRIGDPVRAGDTVLTVLEVKRSRGDSWNRPDEGYIFLFVRLQIENKGDSNAFYHAWDFSVRDKDGNETGDDFAATVALGNRRVINGGELAPGGKVTGWLAFQVPIDDKAPVLVWRPGFLSLYEYEVVLAK